MKQHSVTFYCNTCKSDTPMTVPQLKQHLLETHKISGNLVGKQKGLEFVDFEGGYCNTFEVTLDQGVVLTKVSEGHTVKK